MQIQVMTFEQAEKWTYNPFDVTKVWLLIIVISCIQQVINW